MLNAPRGSLCALVVLLVFLGTAHDQVRTQTQLRTANYVPGELLIGFRPGTSDAVKAGVRALVGVAASQRLRASGAAELELTRLPVQAGLADMLAVLRRHPAVAYAEPNWILTHQQTANDPYYTDGSLWGMHGDGTTPANQFGSQAGEAWQSNTVGSSNVYVGIIDEGIDLNHQDLAPNIWHNPFDVEGDGKDNDGNGYVDDAHGWDFLENNNSIFDGEADTINDRHGTHVAGTIGAVGGNGVGVAGVNWSVTMISGKFLGPSGTACGTNQCDSDGRCQGLRQNHADMGRSGSGRTGLQHRALHGVRLYELCADRYGGRRRHDLREHRRCPQPVSLSDSGVHGCRHLDVLQYRGGEVALDPSSPTLVS